jgi:hypothetical protein
MKYLISFLLLIGISQFSIAQKTKFATAIEYNDYIVGLQNKIGVSINDFVTSLDSASLRHSTKMLNTLTHIIEDAIVKVKAMPSFKGNTSFKEATLQLFVFYKICSQNEYKEMMNLILAEKQPDNLIEKLNELQTRVAKNEEKIDGIFQAEQMKFAKANKFELVDKNEN